MRRFPVVLAFLAASLTAVVALAASDKVVADFVSQSSSGVKGQAMLNALPQGGTMVHAKLAGLQPDVNYISQAFTGGACSSGTATLITKFHANHNGMAVFTAKAEKDLSDIHSVSIQLESDQSLKACAAVTQ